MGMDLMTMMNLLQGGANPENLAMNLLQQYAQTNNPVFVKLMSLAREGPTQEMEQIVRNLLREKGVDYDTAFNSFRQSLKL